MIILLKCTYYILVYRIFTRVLIGAWKQISFPFSIDIITDSQWSVL